MSYCYNNNSNDFTLSLIYCKSSSFYHYYPYNGYELIFQNRQNIHIVSHDYHSAYNMTQKEHSLLIKCNFSINKR